ncbi:MULTISPECIES: ABC transporter permease [unclassified Streptomyces]|uniref:ABC transporter permease n=1 Tax=unclassified Streptomyces TaxID=2593676 RepID=UPI0038117C24
MSALTPHGPAWVTVRLHGRALWTVPVLLVLAFGPLFYLWWRAAPGYGDLLAAGCSLDGDTTVSCMNRADDYRAVQGRFTYAFQLVGLLPPLLPMIVGSFVAGPVIARELEYGTHRLAWTQSVSPARWLLARLALPTAWTVLGTMAFVALYRWTWTSGPFHGDEAYWYENFSFYGLGPVLVGYVVLAIASGALIGLLTRGVVAAMAVTSAAMTVTVLAFGIKLRGYLMPVTRETALGALPDSGWVVDWVEDAVPSELPVSTTFYGYHPASHFWPLQFIETGILLALAALALALAFRTLRRLHA